MEIVISHTSALDFWRRFRGDRRHLQRVHRPEAMIRPVHIGAEFLDKLEGLGFSPTPGNPIDLLFYRDGLRSESRLVSAHATSRLLPPDSLVRLSDRVFISSPELTFAQVAKDYPFEQLSMLGSELCGAYRVLDDDGSPLPLPGERQPLSRVADIVDTVKRLGLGPRTTAARATRYLFDNARSPMEVKVALLLSLPKRMGGLGLPRPVLNPSFRLSPQAHALYPHNPCHPDLFWPAALLDVEYDGADAHPAAAHAKDVARTSAFMLDGMEVITLMKAQVYDEHLFLAVAEIIAKHLHRELPALTPSFGMAHAHLRRGLGL